MQSFARALAQRLSESGIVACSVDVFGNGEGASFRTASLVGLMKGEAPPVPV